MTALATLLNRLDRLDPGLHRRIKGLRLVTASGIGALLGAQPDLAGSVLDGAWLGTLAGGFALWASVSEANTSRARSSRDLAVLCGAAAAGAILYILLAPLLGHLGPAAPELTLVSGAFLVGYLRRFGVLGAGIGSQVFIGQLLAYGAGLTTSALPTIVLAGLLACVASIIPRTLSGPGEHPVVAPPAPLDDERPPEIFLGLQTACAALVIVLLNTALGLEQSAWAITASTYVIASSTAGTLDRARRRIVGTAIGVPLGLTCLPLAASAPVLIWALAALAMIIYAMALPERYDVACGAFAFTLVVTLAVGGEHSVGLLASRAWETLLGAGLGMIAALLVRPRARTKGLA